MAKPKIAFYWCASCGGCEESVVDLAEDILGILDALEIVFWPVALDFKKKDIEAMPDGQIVVSLLNGAIRTSEQEKMAKLLRQKSQVLIAYGACAHLGGIPGLANLFEREEILRFVYEEAPSTLNIEKTRPQVSFSEDGRSVSLPQFHQMVRSLDQVVDVDYYLPGCPPTPKLLATALERLLSGKLPPKGTVLAPDVALCDECPRKDSKPKDLAFKEFKRPHEILLDAENCLLAQEILCLGPATRSGCEALCVKGNMPCTGCFGPTSRVKDQGAKILSFLASALEAQQEKEIDKVVSQIPDPVGSFYRYSLPKSILRRKLIREKESF